MSTFGGYGIVRRCRWPTVICVLIIGGLQLSPVPSQPLGQPFEQNSNPAEEPIIPVPAPPTIDPLKVKLGNVYSAILVYLAIIRVVAHRATISARMAQP